MTSRERTKSLARPPTKKPAKRPPKAAESAKLGPVEAQRASLLAAALPGLPAASLLPWFHFVAPGQKLPPGAVSASLRVPVAIANRLLASTARLVADLPQGVSGDVVWSHADAELLVHTQKLSLACAPGLVSLSIAVACDQVAQGATVVVPLAVGSEERPAGLVMSAFARPAGPDVICSLWSEALTAFAWEVLLHLAQQLCGATGHDAEGRVLVPASIAAARDVLILQPMARNELSRHTEARR